MHIHRKNVRWLRNLGWRKSSNSFKLPRKTPNPTHSYPTNPIPHPLHTGRNPLSLPFPHPHIFQITWFFSLLVLDHPPPPSLYHRTGHPTRHPSSRLFPQSSHPPCKPEITGY